MRAVEPGDLEFTRRWRNDPQVTTGTLGRRFPITPNDEEAWFRSLSNGGRFPESVPWIITANGAICGLGQLNEIDWIHRTAWFGVWIAPAHWGGGHGDRATRLVVHHGLVDLGLRQVRLRVLPSNERAITVYRKVGFVDEGVQSGAVLVDGVATDVRVMRIDQAALPVVDA